MFVLNQSDLLSFDLKKSSKFIEFWNRFYNYQIMEENGSSKIDYFEELNIGNNLTLDNVKKLLRWKDPKYFSEIIKSGNNAGIKNRRVIKVLEKIDQINKFRNGVLCENEFDKVLMECFPNGNQIWNTFLKHIVRPNTFPIYDQHVYRSYCWHNKVAENEICKNYNKYKEYFFLIYGSETIDLSISTIRRMKELDNALMAFGQFLKKYGKRPTIASTG